MWYIPVARPLHTPHTPLIAPYPSQVITCSWLHLIVPWCPQSLAES